MSATYSLSHMTLRFRYLESDETWNLSFDVCTCASIRFAVDIVASLTTRTKQIRVLQKDPDETIRRIVAKSPRLSR